jgi:protein TonB
MTQPTNIIRLGDRLGAPARRDDNPLQLHPPATPVVGPADRIAKPDVAADLTNVIAFTLLRSDGPVDESAPKLVVSADDRSATIGRRDGVATIAALLLCSGLIHAAILTVLNREPKPLASIGTEVISVELVLGTNSATGLATVEPEVRPQTTAPPEPATATRDTPMQEEKPEPAPDPAVDVRRPPVAEPEPVAPKQQAALPDPTQEPPVAVPEPTPAHPVALAAPPAERPAEPRKPVEQAPPPRPTKPVARPAPAGQKRPAARPRTDERVAARQPPQGGVGPGRSDAVSTYIGIVQAHLKRYQHPDNTLKPGEHPSCTVSFTIDGNGRVSGIKLVRSSGLARLDQEAAAMVRRASPFPPPPGGLTSPITAPIAFSVR